MFQTHKFFNHILFFLDRFFKHVFNSMLLSCILHVNALIWLSICECVSLYTHSQTLISTAKILAGNTLVPFLFRRNETVLKLPVFACCIMSLVLLRLTSNYKKFITVHHLCNCLWINISSLYLYFSWAIYSHTFFEITY